MSEADRPTNLSPSASSDAASAAPAAQEPIDPSPPHLGDDEGWETVNLPNQISMDALEQQSDNHPETSLALSFPGLTAPGGLATTTPEAWKSDNLVDRIAKLEIAIQEYRDRLAQDQARSDAQRQLLAQRSVELKAANEQIEVQNRHIEALEAQTAQQQSTIDRLSTEVESLSQQIAQIERECALTQQRYTQESHLRQKAEINVQELRSRLHRQQHHTLQFKAALEKCLEVPLNPDTPTAKASTTEANTSIFPKAPPIQPWSALGAEMGGLLARRDQVTGGNGETGGPGDGGTRGPGGALSPELVEGSKGDQGTGGRRFGFAHRPGDQGTGAPGGALSPELVEGSKGDQGTRGPGDQGTRSLPVSPSPRQEVGERSRTAIPPSPRPPVSISPSPLVYPKDANVKKRRSLAAVQLPNFAT